MDARLYQFSRVKETFPLERTCMKKRVLIRVLILVISCLSLSVTGCAGVDEIYSIIYEEIGSELDAEKEDVVYDASDEVVFEQVPVDGGKYYYELLNDQEKSLYQDVLTAYFNYSTTINLEKSYSDMDRDSIYKVHQYVLLDYPEIFWIDEQGSVKYYEDDGVETQSELIATLNYTEEEITNYESELENIVMEVEALVADSSNDYEKAITVYEYIITNCNYDNVSAELILNQSDYTVDMIESTSVIGSLINGEAVCAGYVGGYNYLLDKIGIDAFSVIGTADGVGHEWNMIAMDGCYYYVDCTWGDTIVEEDEVSYNYFGLTTEQIEKSHILDMEYPTCVAKEYNYYVYNELCFSGYDYGTIEEVFDTAISEGEEEISFSFTTYEAYATANSSLIDSDFSKILSKHIDDIETQYSYLKDDDLYIITTKLTYK